MNSCSMTDLCKETYNVNNFNIKKCKKWKYVDNKSPDQTERGYSQKKVYLIQKRAISIKYTNLLRISEAKGSKWHKVVFE